MDNTVQQSTPQLERIEIYATLTDQENKKEYKYQQTCFIEGTIRHIYEENLAKTNFNNLLKEMQNKIKDLFNVYLGSDEGKNSEYAHITDRNERILEDNQYSLITENVEKAYEPKLNELRSRCKVKIEDVYPDLQLEEGAILFNLKDKGSLLTENRIEEVAFYEVKEWSKKLISDKQISACQVESKIFLSNKTVIEKLWREFFIFGN